jgi:hypothetical protein
LSDEFTGLTWAELAKATPRPGLSLVSAAVAEENQPWFRQPAAIFAAGGAGLVLLIALVVTVVKLSDQWSQPISTTVFTTQVTTEQTLRSTEPFVVTPSDSSTSYPTSVSVSTTEIGLPSDSTTSSTTDTTDTPIVTTDPRYPGTHPYTTSPSPGAGPSTTQNRPRFNVTRTLAPG